MKIARWKTKGKKRWRTEREEILQFILEEQLLPHVSDGYQLPLRQRDVGKERGERKTN